MKSMLFVFNRFAGNKRMWTHMTDVLNTMTEEGYLVSTYSTQSEGDTSTIIERIGMQFDRIVVAGGDGTLNEAVSGVLKLNSPPPLGYIPVGTTNDFSKNMNLPTELTEIVKIACHGTVRPCDTGSFNGRSFIYVAAFGAFTDVSFSTPQSIKNLLGYSAYLLESVKRIGSIKPYHITVQYDGKELTGDFIYGMVSNTKQVGGLKHLPPGNPQLDDGLLEVTLISPPQTLAELEHFSRSFILGDMVSILESPMLQTFSAKEIQLTADNALLWALDGENGGVHKIAKISAVPRAFTLVFGNS